jgi:hypothetical protein
MEKFFAWPPHPDCSFTRGEVVRWWASRQLRYNGYLLFAGVLSISITLLIDSPSDFNNWQDWLLTGLFLLIVANVCYTFGWIIDTIIYRAKPSRRLYQVGIIFSVVLLSLPAAWSVGTFLGGRNKHRVGRAIVKEIQSGTTQVDIEKIANFEWDRMFVFGPYYPREYICKDLKITEWQCKAAGIADVDEGDDLLVFMNQGTVADAETIPRYFDESERCMSRPIRREEAKFMLMGKPRAMLVCK